MKITQKELLEWLKWYNQWNNGYHLSESDYAELIRLNHRVMELTHNVHNDNMLKDKE